MLFSFIVGEVRVRGRVRVTISIGVNGQVRVRVATCESIKRVGLGLSGNIWRRHASLFYSG